MKARLAIFCLPLMVLIAPRLLAQEEAELKSIRVQVMLLETSGTVDAKTRAALSGPSDAVGTAVRELVSKGEAVLINHADMTVIEQSESVLQIGETVARVNGTVRVTGGREIRNIEDVEVGTIISIRSKVEDGAVVLMDFDLSKSFLTGGDEEAGIPQGVSQLTNQSTVQIRDGNAQLIGSMVARGSGDEMKGVHVVLMAEILHGTETKQATRFRSFPSSAARRSSSESRPESARASADPRRSAPAFRPSGPRPGASRPTSSRFSQEEMKTRISDGLFKRADSDGNGVISESELSSLQWRAPDAKAPITAKEYKAWAEANWPPTRESMFRNSSSSQRARSSRSSRTRPTEADEKEDSEEEEDADEEKDDTESDDE
ncbi:MAG: hypothetical protein AAGG48_09850 [Planctomycetota bacterium]